MPSSQEASPKSRPFVCPWCDALTLAEVRGVATWDGFKNNEPVNPPVEYSLVQCSECGDASLEMREDFGMGFVADRPGFAYPAKRRLSNDVPRPLRREFDEAQKCLSVKAYGATVVMVRRILEGVCKENSIQERTLVRSLEELQKNGLIDGTISTWATALRLLGNEGAHYTGRQVPRDDAEDALAFSEALLDHIYVLRKRFTEFETRRASKKGSTPATP
jgi:hypothetical protein